MSIPASYAEVTSQIRALQQQIEDARKLKQRAADQPNLEGWKTQTEMLIKTATGGDPIAFGKFHKLTFTRAVPVAVFRNGTTRPSGQELKQIDESAYQDDLDTAIGIIEAVIKILVSKLPATPADEPVAIGEIRSTLKNLRFLKATRTLLMADFEEGARAYQNGAYKACVVMCGAVMEGLLLGNLERTKNIQLLWDAGRLTDLTTREGVRRKLRESSLEDLINHTRKSNCIDGFTDEIAKMVQRCRNSIHPGRVLRGDEVLDAFDKRAADLALGFLNVLCPLIARS